MTTPFSDLGRRRGVRVLRWSARTIGAMAALLFLTMFFGDVMESNQRESFVEATRRLWPRGVIGLAVFMTYVAALLLSLRWERLGLWLGSVMISVFFVLMAFGLVNNEAPIALDLRPLRNPVWLIFVAPLALYAMARWAERRLPPPH